MYLHLERKLNSVAPGIRSSQELPSQPCLCPSPWLPAQGLIHRALAAVRGLTHRSIHCEASLSALPFQTKTQSTEQNIVPRVHPVETQVPIYWQVL